MGMEPRAPGQQVGQSIGVAVGRGELRGCIRVVIVEREFLFRPEDLIDFDRRNAGDALPHIKPL